MKKSFTFLAVTVSLLGLSACSKTTAKAPSSTETANLTIEFSKNDIEKFDKISLKKNETAMTLLKSKEKVVEKAGFITKIGSVEQDTAKNLYWMYKVNGKLASVGASDQVVKNGDTVTFYLGD